MINDSLRTRILHRTPHAWRGPMLAVLVDRPIAFLLVLGCAVAVLVGLLAARTLAAAQSILAYYAAAVALGTTRGIISADRYPGRWYLLFQRRGRASAYYYRILALTAALVICLLFLPAMAVGITAGVAAAAAAFAGSLLWTATLTATAMGISSVVRRYDLELVLLLVFVSFGQRFLAMELTSTAAAVASYVLLPVDGIFMIWRRLLGDGAWPHVSRLIQIAIYPVIWIAIASRQIARFDQTVSVHAEDRGH